ncbi:Transcription initiation factor tfiid subunit [Thalictrum thalictroides]|uniref:Transcription initiation factor tfiid subunit n=1 Tax=Thalictrum thalictroides TaxID=46969 RepID=A0A7J6VZV0_THATH|nr:Transcription initiation factor tfiid subunit [Thalictrum thalictroides]
MSIENLRDRKRKIAAVAGAIATTVGGISIFFLSSLLKRIDRLLQFDRLMPSYNGILTISCIRSLTQIALKLSASVPLDRVSELIKPFRGFGTSWKVRIEASRALLDLEFHCNGIDAALLLFTRFLEEESSLRGQVKLAVHAMRLCQIRRGSEDEEEIKGSTLVIFLRLLESRKAFSNVFLRHHLFCILQTLSGRPPTLYGIPRSQVRPSGETETCSEQSKAAAFLKLKVSRPPESLMDVQNPFPDVLPLPEASREADTVSNGSERRRPVVKIRVKQSAASSRADEGENVFVDTLQAVQDETERGGSSSMSVDAPIRTLNEPVNVDCQILEEVNSFHDLGSRVTASIGSAKLANNEDEARKELQCTADSSKVECPLPSEDRSSPNSIKGNGVEQDAQKYASLQTLSVGTYGHDGLPLAAEDRNHHEKEKKEKKKKDKDKKRKREKDDHKRHRDDPEYLEKKRLKKEKKQKEKEMKKLQSGDGNVSTIGLVKTNPRPRVELPLQTGDNNNPFLVEPRSTNEEPRVMSASVELKPREPSGSKLVIKTVETKADSSEGTSVHKFRIKIKNRSLNKS